MSSRQMPHGWGFAAVDDLAVSRSSGFWGQSAASEGSVPVRVIRNGDIDVAGKIASAADRWLSVPERDRSCVHSGDVLITTSGAVGKLHLVRLTDPSLCVSNFVRTIRPRVDVVAPAYLYWALHGQLAREALSANSGGSTIRNLRTSFFSEPCIPLAPLAEQHRIVAEVERRLSHVDAAVQGLQRSLALVASARAATLNRTFTSAHQVPDAQATWPVHRMGEVFEVSVGSTPRRDSPALWDGDVPWVSSGEVAWCHIRATRESISPTAGLRVHPRGTVMLGMIGEGKTRGQAAILDIAAAHNQNCASIRVSDTEHIPEWIYYQLMAQYSRTRAAGSGNNQQALNKKLVQSMEVVLPPPDEQRQLVAGLDRDMSLLDSAQRTVERQLARCEQARRAILEAAFRGELVPQDPDDEPAADLLERIRKEHETTTGRTRRKKEART